MPPYSDGFLAGIKVSRETWESLEDYCVSLLTWSRAINLVSNAKDANLWHRHILDCAQLWSLRHPETKAWADIGTGGGLPGLVMAIIGRELSPQTRFHLVESDKRKVAFLRFVQSRQDLTLVLHAERIETLPPIGAQTLSARALAPLHQLLGFAARHLDTGGTALFPKGRKFKEEIDDAKKKWNFLVEEQPSKVDSGARILQVTSIQPLRKP